MIHSRKRALLEGASDVFERGGGKPPEIDEEQVKEQRARIGELAAANDLFVTKAQAPGPEMRRGMVERDNPDLPTGGPCKPLSMLRSSFDDQPEGEPAMNLMLMRQIDEPFWEAPFFRCPAGDACIAARRRLAHAQGAGRAHL